ncbi:MAG: hypothetical protein AB8G23_05425 [Myxococcota bacterium]
MTLPGPGSYRLTSNLIIPNENTSGIIYNASDVSIDLNNFGIIRSGCENNSLCIPVAGTGFGIGKTGFDNARVSIKNGRVIGMGARGLDLANHSEVARMHLSSNGLDGLSTGVDSMVEKCLVSLNSEFGIISPKSVISENSVSGNGLTGISAGSGSIVIRNAVKSNGDQGINAGIGSTVSANNVFRNGTSGISVTSGSSVSDNTIRDNASHGVIAGADSYIYGNTVSSNGGYGLLLVPSDVSYRNNMISGNTAGTVSGGVNMLGNSCNGTTTCP